MKRLLLFLAIASTVPLSAQTVEIPPATAAALRIRTLIDTAPAAQRADVRNFYAPAAFRPAWTAGGRPTAQALAVISALERAESHGLNPFDYDAGRWQSRLDALSGEAAIADFDVTLTAAAMRYVADVRIGRVSPREVRFDLDVASRRLYLPATIAQLAASPDAAGMLARLEPQHDDYRRLKGALARYRAIAAQEAGEAPLPGAKVQPGDAYDALPRLADRLRRHGDLDDDAVVTGTRYEGAIVDAVKQFQERHGLDPDGVLGARTFAALNVPASRRVAQIELALERWRWTPEPAAERAVIVNIPEFRLRARDAEGEMSMRVVVGRASRSETPVFDGGMRHVVIRPYWSVPASIQRGEIVPKLRRDRGYLARNGYEIVDSTGASRGSSVDDETLAALSSLSLRVRQKPGRGNSLGLVKFLFPNDNSVYLHDTPSQSHFERARRDYSHGCIRVEDPAALAAWVLRDDAGWTVDKIRAAMNGTRDDMYVRLARPIPVMILYATAVARENGKVHFFDDIYGHDAELVAALAPRSAAPKVLVADGGTSAQAAAR